MIKKLVALCLAAALDYSASLGIDASKKQPLSYAQSESMQKDFFNSTEPLHSGAFLPYISENGKKITIVLDDCGASSRDLANLEMLLDAKLGDGIVYAVMPGQPYTSQILRVLADNNQYVILHQPGERYGDKKKKRDATKVYSADSIQDVKIKLRKNIESILSELKKANKTDLFLGLNTHESSIISKDTKKHRQIFMAYGEVLHEYELNLGRNLFFLDSVTIQNSVARQAASGYTATFKRNCLFLDHLTDEANVRKAIGVIRNSKTYHQITLGHLGRKNTVPVLVLEFSKHHEIACK